MLREMKRRHLEIRPADDEKKCTRREYEERVKMKLNCTERECKVRLRVLK